MNDERKPTIDERLEALTQSLELMQHEQERIRKEQERLFKREQNARMALMAGIAAYLQALKNGGDEREPQ